MLVAQRHENIVKILIERESIRVSELSEIFKVTEETIRRDLEKLEKEGYLKRSHGGAVITKESQNELSYLEREVINVESKKEVAQIALDFIDPNDRIILDASSTAWYMARILPDIPLTVLTNSIKVSLELSTKEKISVHSIGGLLWAKSLSFVGPQAERALENYYVDKAFMSCKGVDANWGLSDSNELQALVKRKMIGISEKTYLLVDHSKFGVKSFSRISNLDNIEYIISDSKTKLVEEEKSVFSEKGIKIIGF